MKVARGMLIGCIVLLGYSLILFLVNGGLCIFVVGGILAVGIFAKQKGRELWACGSSRWATADGLKRAGMLGTNHGMILGRMSESAPNISHAVSELFNVSTDSQDACEQFLGAMKVAGYGERVARSLVRLSTACHIAVFAPTGVGKGVSCVVVNLLTRNAPTVTVDFKGENSRLTSAHRQKVFGRRQVILDPFKQVTQYPDTFNPLDFIDKDSPYAIDECRDLAEALVIRTGEEKEPHWNDSAEAWIAGITAAVVFYGKPGERSLQTVRAVLSHPKKVEAIIKLMCGSDAWGGMLSRMGQQLSHYRGEELGSTMTTTGRQLRFLDTPAVFENTQKSSFNPGDLAKGEIDVFLVLPPEHLRAQSGLLRVWLGSFLRAVVKNGLQEQTKVHFELDEAASIGHLNALDDAIDKYRAYGVRLIFYYQSVSQLKKCWPQDQDQTLLSNTTQVFFGVNDWPTAQYVSDRLGAQTIEVESGGTSVGSSYQVSTGGGSGSSTSSHNRNDNWQQQQRPLLYPAEVMALSSRIAIAFVPSMWPIWTRLLRYYEEPELGFGKVRAATSAPWWQTFGLSAAVCAVGLGVAIVVTNIVFRQPVPYYVVPNGSVQRQGVYKR